MNTNKIAQNTYRQILKDHAIGLLVVFISWLLVVCTINPIGEFAINDDWSYAHNVQALHDLGKFQFSNWPAMTLIGQTIPAWIWSELVGFNLTNLRVLTLLFELGTLFLVYALIGSVTDRRLALVGTLLVLVNPIFMALSFSFMTEVYYLFYFLGMLYFAHRYFKCKTTADYAFMLLFMILAILTRQIALIATPIIGIVLLISDKHKIKTWIMAGLPAVVGIVTLVLYKQFRLSTGSGMGTFSSATSLIKGLFNYPLLHYIDRIGLIFLYIGLLSTPVLLIKWRMIKEVIISRLMLSIVLFVILGIVMYSARHSFPIGNILDSIGIGPHLTKDVPAGLHVNDTSSIIWNILYLVAYLNALFIVPTVVISSILGIKSIKEEDPIELVLLGLICSEFFYLIINPIFFDRYVLTVIILIVIWLFRKQKTSSSWSFLILALVIITPLIFVSDFMKWQRTRAELTQRLMNGQDITLEEIDGGFEFNAWHKVAPIGEVSYNLSDKSWWFVKDDTYIVSSAAKLDNYEAIDSLPTGTLFNSLEKVYILKRVQ